MFKVNCLEQQGRDHKDGVFSISPQFTPDEQLLLHFEKPGYKPADLLVSAGDQKIDMQLQNEAVPRR